MSQVVHVFPRRAQSRDEREGLPAS
jgi:hypothetical protein